MVVLPATVIWEISSTDRLCCFSSRCITWLMVATTDLCSFCRPCSFWQKTMREMTSSP